MSKLPRLHDQLQPQVDVIGSCDEKYADPIHELNSVCDVIVGIRVYAIYDCKKYMLAMSVPAFQTFSTPLVFTPLSHSLATFVAAETALMVRTVVRLVRELFPPCSQLEQRQN